MNVKYTICNDKEVHAHEGDGIRRALWCRRSGRSMLGVASFASNPAVCGSGDRRLATFFCLRGDACNTADMMLSMKVRECHKASIKQVRPWYTQNSCSAMEVQQSVCDAASIDFNAWAAPELLTVHSKYSQR